MSLYSSFRYLGNCLNELLLDKRVISNITTKSILCVLQKYIEALDERWSDEKQQSYFDKCVNEIKDIIDTDVSMMDVETYSTINSTFDTLQSTMTTAVEEKQVEPEGYQVIDSALSQLRQTMIALFSRLINANKNLEKDVRQMKMTLTNIEARLVSVEAESLAMKKSNFIADLMAPLLDKIMDKMQEKSIDWHWYSSRELTRLKTSINRDPNWINSHPLAAIISDVATTYGLAPGVLIDHLKIKQDRNYSAHYTQKIRTYASESKEFFWLSDFISKHAELQAFSELEKTVLQPVFFNVCKEMMTRSETTVE